MRLSMALFTAFLFTTAGAFTWWIEAVLFNGMNLGGFLAFAFGLGFCVGWQDWTFLKERK